MSLEFRALKDTDKEKEECLDLWCAAFDSTSREYFARYFYGDVEWLPYYTQVAVLEGKIVSSVTTVKRTVSCGEFRLTMGGVANVSTYKEHRGKGYNAECLKRIIGVMEADAFDFTTLGTGITDYYAKFGYEIERSKRLSGTIREDFSPRETPFQVRLATPEDRPAIQEIYRIYNAKRPIAVQRDESYWRGWVCDSAEQPFLALGANREIVGYAATAIGTHHGSAMGDRSGGVSEFGTLLRSPEEKRQVAGALLDSLTALTLANGNTRFNVDISHDAEILQILETTFTTRKWTPERHGMIRLLHQDNLIKSLLMDLNECWSGAGKPSGVLDFQTPYGCFRVDARGGLLKAEPVENSVEALSQSTFCALLFGALSPIEATSDSTRHELISALFPYQPAIFYSADGF